MRKDTANAAVFVSGMCASALMMYTYIISKQPEPYQVQRPLGKLIPFPVKA